MDIKTLKFCEPFYTMKEIKNGIEYKIEKTSIILNLGENDILIKDKPLGYLKSTIVKNVMINNIKKALVIEDFENSNNNPELLDGIKKKWPLMYEINNIERYKGIPVRRSPKEKIGGVELNLFYVDAMTDIGLHKEHNYWEIHTQIMGVGKMQKFEENKYNTIYQEEILAPGATHEPFYNDEGIYPWHQYQSISECVYLYVVIDRLQ